MISSPRITSYLEPRAGTTPTLFTRHEDATRFVEEVRSDDPDVASKLGIEERELGAGPRD